MVKVLKGQHREEVFHVAQRVFVEWHMAYLVLTYLGEREFHGIDTPFQP